MSSDDKILTLLGKPESDRDFEATQIEEEESNV
jgi:hypothetical protein